LTRNDSIPPVGKVNRLIEIVQFFENGFFLK